MLLNNVKISTRLSLGLILIFIVLFSLTLFAISRMDILSDQTTKIYRHPLTVSNAVLRIHANIIKMHRSMKDVALTNDPAIIEESARTVDQLEAEVLKDFRVIDERFLGEKKQYEAALVTFVNWKPIRDEVILLMNKGMRMEAADITRGKGALYVENIESAMQFLGNFAQSKATEFLQNAEQTRRSSFRLMYIMLTIAMFTCLLFAIYLFRSITGPIKALSAATDRIGTGDLDSRVQIESEDEIGQLAKSFNRMTDDLERITASRDTRTSELAQITGRFTGLFNSSKDAIGWADLDGTLIDVNKAFCTLTGYTREELLSGTKYQELTPQEYHAEEAELIRDLLETGEPVEYEKENIRKDGSRVPLFLTVFIVKDENNNTIGVAAIIKDITEQKSAEVDRRYHSEVTLNMSEGVYLTRVNDGIIVYANPKFEEMFGYGPGEMVGQHVSIVNAPTEVSPEETVGEIMGILLKTGTWQGEIQNIKKDGTPFWCYASVSVFVHPEHGKVLISVHTDITEKKKVEDQIITLNVDLRRRTLELESLNSELESFSYSVSHDLKVPLRAIDGFSSILKEDFSDALNDEGRRILDVINSSVHRMSELINDILEFSRLGRQSVKKSEVNIEELAKNIFKEQMQSLPDRRVTLKIDPMPPAKADESMIRQVFINLISNAIKFTGDRETGVLEIKGVSGDNETVYNVKDNGIGFDMKYADKIFKVFHRLHNTNDFEGTGVGLALVERIINRHGGHVWAEGSVNKGTIISFSLPSETPSIRPNKHSGKISRAVGHNEVVS